MFSFQSNTIIGHRSNLIIIYSILSCYLGRAIRHINDYATIILLDQRYARSTVQQKLPQWISSRLQTHTGFGPAFCALRKVI